MKNEKKFGKFYGELKKTEAKRFCEVICEGLGVGKPTFYRWIRQGVPKVAKFAVNYVAKKEGFEIEL